MNTLRITPVDEEAVNNGSWTTYRGVKLKIARSTNQKFKTVFMRLSKPYQRRLATDMTTTSDEDSLREILCKALANAILIDWGNFVIDGKEIPYTEDNGFSLLMNDEDCRQFVSEYSQNLENFIKEEEDASTGKL